MNNFPFNWQGKDYWYSRSVVCSCYTFCHCYGEWYVLAAWRGHEETNPGLMNVPGGFLDHNETLQECAIRETMEETGVDIGGKCLSLYKIDDKPRGRRQHVIISFFCNFGEVPFLPHVTNGANTEVAWCDWMKIKSIDNQIWLDENKTNIHEIYKRYINVSLLNKIKNFIWELMAPNQIKC